MPPLAAAALATLIGGTFGDTIGGMAGLSDGPAAAMPQVGSHLYGSVGIAEKDATTGIFWKTAVLLGPDGIIGKYRKNGLNGEMCSCSARAIRRWGCL